jgi:hypothetical protein
MANRLMILAVVVFALAIGTGFAADAQPTTARINPLAFHQADNNEFTFDTTVLRGKLHANGKPMGLTNVVHIPSGKRLDDTYKLAWKRGLKTTYYLRSMGATHAEKSTVKAGQLNAVPEGGMSAAGMSANPAEPKFCSIDNPECEACQ